MDIRLHRLQSSVVNFFEHEMSVSFLELPQTARHHLEAFRSFLKQTYIEEYGCWPPRDFQEGYIQQDIYAALLSDFQNLYQYLVDPESTTNMEETDVSKTGGVCTIQNIQAFDARYEYQPLAQPLPLMPRVAEPNSDKRAKSQRRMSWNPVQKRKADKEARKVRDKQALVAATNSDLLVMDCHLVRKFAKFEEQTVDDDLEGLSVVEGRKVRWMLIYAILQTFHSISPPPKQVRNSTDLTYSLRCRPPKQMPWQDKAVPPIRMVDQTPSKMVPDQSYSHTNTTPPSGEQISRGRSLKARRLTLPAKMPSSPIDSLPTKTPPISRSSSLRRLMPRRHQSAVEPMPPPKRAPFCEIYIAGYGNGLNEVQRDFFVASPAELTAEPEAAGNLNVKGRPPHPQEPAGDVHELDADVDQNIRSLRASDSSQAPPLSMSRESSNASRSSDWSHGSSSDDLDPTTPATEAICTLREILQATGLSMHPDQMSGSDPKASTVQSTPANHVAIMDDEADSDDAMSMPSVHFNTLTWDRILAEPQIAVHG